MKIPVLILVLGIGGAANSGAVTLKAEPDYRFAWNQFTSVATVDSIAVLAGPEGILTAVYDKTSDRFKPTSLVLSTDSPSRIIVGDSVVAIIFENSRVCLLDRLALPQLVVRGYVDLPDSTYDLVFWRQHIFFAAGFRGLLHSRLIDNERLGPLDSTQEGVHIVSLSIQNDRLLAADDYNGLLEYHIDPSGSPQFVSQLNLPFQCTDIAQAGDTALMARMEQDSMVIAVRTSTGWSAPKLLGTPFGCQYVFVMDTFVVVVSRDLVGFSALTRRSLSLINSVPNYSGKSLAYPAQFGADVFTRIILPGQSGGLLQYWLALFDYSYSPSEAYFPTGAVTSLAFAGKWLVAGGMGGWCHGYDCVSTPVPDTEITIYDQVGVIAKVIATGQGVAILNSALRKVNLTKDEGQGPRPFATYFLGHAASNMFWGRKSIANSTPVVFWSGAELYLHRFSGAIEMPYTAQLKVPIGIKSAAIVDSLLVLSVAKSGLWVYRIHPDYTLGVPAQVEVTSEIGLLIDIPSWPSCLAGIQSNQLSRISFVDPVSPHFDTTIILPLEVTDAYVDYSLLYTIGPESTAVWTIAPDGSLPVLAGATPYGGYSVAGNGTVMAITNGDAIYTFDLRGPTDVDQPGDILPVTSTLLGNYPNPFNPSTIIAYEISSPGDISLTIFNALGQRVRELERIHRTPGQYQTEWNGRDDHDRPVASGTYFCRLISREGARTGKMMLVR
jgi:hypothetical protein